MLQFLNYIESENCSVVPASWHPVDGSPPGYWAPGISQARILAWVAISFSRGSSRPGNPTWVSCIAGGFFTNWTRRGAPAVGRGQGFPWWRGKVHSLPGQLILVWPEMTDLHHGALHPTGQLECPDNMAAGVPRQWSKREPGGHPSASEVACVVT